MQGLTHDEIFTNPLLASVYDPLEADRSDLDHYAAMAQEFGAREALDIGCGTGTLAIMLARRGLRVTAVDPAKASVDVARGKPHAHLVSWIDGELHDAPPMQADVAFMTANVAQVFLTDDAWQHVLGHTAARLRPGGRLVFETRDPARRAWERWTPQHSRVAVDIAGIGVVESWEELQEVSGPLVTFTSYTSFRDTGETLVSTSTLIFRGRGEMDESLLRAGFEVAEVRDAPDRPGAEFVYIARKQ